MAFKVLLLLLSSYILSCQGKCTPAEVSTYTSPDSFFSSETVFSVELVVTCDNKNPSLYALIEDQLILVTRSTGNNKYQVSWSVPHDKAPKGTLVVNFYDDEGASALRKSMRYGEDVNVAPLFKVDVEHKGIKSVSFINPGFVAMLIALLVWWIANTTRQKLVE